MIMENALPKRKHAFYVKKLGTLQSAAMIMIGSNPITSQLVLQELIKPQLQPSKQKLRPSSESPHGE